MLPLADHRDAVRVGIDQHLGPERGWVVMRVPYPLGYYTKWMDGRIDDADAGWKGRSLWANYGTHLVWHIEGGKGRGWLGKRSAMRAMKASQASRCACRLLNSWSSPSSEDLRV
jgi:hypothetical protein